MRSIVRPGKSAHRPPGRSQSVVLALGTTQTLAWASSYYLPAILADPIARDLGISATAVFAAFSAALLLSAAFGPVAGRVIDRGGGRSVLCLSNLVFAAGLALLASAHEPVALTLAWLDRSDDFSLFGFWFGVGRGSRLISGFGHGERRC